MAAAPVPRNTGPKWGKGIGCGLVVKAAGYLGRSQKRHGMAYGAAGKQHGVAGAYKRRNTQGRVEGAFSYLNWRLCTGSCSAGSTRPDAGLRPPSIASRPLADRCLRPPSTVDRGLRPPPQIAGSRSMLQLPIHELNGLIGTFCDCLAPTLCCFGTEELAGPSAAAGRVTSYDATAMGAAFGPCPRVTS